MELDHCEIDHCEILVCVYDNGHANKVQVFACRPACLASQGVSFNSEDGHPCTDGMDRPPQTSKH